LIVLIILYTILHTCCVIFYSSSSLQIYSVKFILEPDDLPKKNDIIGLIEHNTIHHERISSAKRTKEVERKSVYGNDNIKDVNSNILPKRQNVLKLPRPVILLGMMKSGTTSVYDFFKCADVPSTHYCCSPGATDHPPCHPAGTPANETNDHLCGYCIKNNISRGRPPLEGCGDDATEVYAQMDCEMGGWRRDARTNETVHTPMYLYMPQITALDALHAHYPDATFILNLRDPVRWESSVRNWFQLKGRFKKTHLPEYGYPRGTVALQEFYVNHTKRVRDFVKTHPSHALVEVNIEEENAGDVMAEAFGLSPSCWGKSNANSGRLK